jgi:8-oxo-dGTP pyrophosphatase MutT (NUDIX family)
MMKEISAGGVVYRKEGEKPHVLLIEDRYAKWTLPKGKLEDGETVEEAALREILEETGITGRIICPIGVITYHYYHPKHGQVDKEVHYYLVEAVEGELQAQLSEINTVRWIEPQEAWSLQLEGGYGNNDHIVKEALIELGIPFEN